MVKLKIMSLMIMLSITGYLLPVRANAQTALDRLHTQGENSSSPNPRTVIRILRKNADMIQQVEAALGKDVVAEKITEIIEDNISSGIENTLAAIDELETEDAQSIVSAAQLSAKRSGDRSAIRAIRDIVSDVRFQDDIRSQAKEVLRSVQAEKVRSRIESAVAAYDGSVSKLLRGSIRSLQRYGSDISIFDPFGLSRKLWEWAETKSRPGIFWRVVGVVLGSPFTLTFDFCVVPFLIAGAIWDGLVDIFTETEEEKRERLNSEQAAWERKESELYERIAELKEEIRELKNGSRLRADETGQYKR